MNMNEWYAFDEGKDDRTVFMFSVNGVPYPLDEYLRLKGEPTTGMVAEMIRKWG